MSAPAAAGLLPGRDRLVVLASLGVLVVGAWVYLAYLAQGKDEMVAGSGTMGEMAMSAAPRPWSAAEFLAMLVMWIVMMIGMMLPSAAPLVLLYAALSRRHREAGRAFPSTGVFASAYVLAWSLFSLIATAVQWGLHSVLLLSPMMTTTSPILGGAILIAAGLYQFSPLKQACLRHCRSPLGFLMTRWRDGAGGALLMGLEHGLFCLGCCWVLMLLLFVGGVMNLLWVAAIALFVLIEKLAPRGEFTARVAGVTLIAWGSYLAIWS